VFGGHRSALPLPFELEMDMPFENKAAGLSGRDRVGHGSEIGPNDAHVLFGSGELDAGIARHLHFQAVTDHAHAAIAAHG